jgi:hypothetical protein
MGRPQQHRFRSGAKAIFAFGALTLLISATIVAQDNQFQLFISAVDESGSQVTDLKAGDVSMAESGAPGTVVLVERFNLPVKLTIVVDNNPDSQLVLAQYRSGLNGLVDALPKDVEISLYTTAPQPRAMVRFTTNR